MIIADTSVWVAHFRRTEDRLVSMLDQSRILMHPFILGELALGGVPDRKSTLSDMARLPRCAVASDSEVLTLIESERLYGQGVGYIDASLLAAARLTSGASLWTLDARLSDVARSLAVAHAP